MEGSTPKKASQAKERIERRAMELGWRWST
jgi:hypothetical protein